LCSNTSIVDVLDLALVENLYPNQQKNGKESVDFLCWFGHVDSDSMEQKIVYLIVDLDKCKLRINK